MEVEAVPAPQEAQKRQTDDRTKTMREETLVSQNATKTRHPETAAAKANPTEQDYEAILRSEGLAPEPGEALFPEDVVGYGGDETAAGAGGADEHETVSLSDRLLGSLSDASASNEVEEALLAGEGTQSLGAPESLKPSPAATDEDLVVLDRVYEMGYAATLPEAAASEETIRRLADAGLANLRADGRETVLAMAGATDGDVRKAGARARSEREASRLEERLDEAYRTARRLVARLERLTATNGRLLYAALAPRMPRGSFSLLLRVLGDADLIVVYGNGDVEKAGAEQDAVVAAVDLMQAVEERAVRHREARERVRRGSFLRGVSGYDPRDDERPEADAYRRGLVALLGVQEGGDAFARIVRDAQARMGLEPAVRATKSLLAFVAAVLGADLAAPAPLVAARLACRALEGIRLLRLGRWPAEVFAKRRNARRRTVGVLALLRNDAAPLAPQLKLRSGAFLLSALHRALREVQAGGFARGKVPYEEVLEICADLPFKAGYDFFGWEGEEASEARAANRRRMRSEFVERRRSGRPLVVRTAKDLDEERRARKNDPAAAVIGQELREKVEEQSRTGRGRYNARAAFRRFEALKEGRSAPLADRVLGHLAERGGLLEEWAVRLHFAGTPEAELDDAFAELHETGRVRRLKSRRNSETYLKAVPASEPS